MDLNLSEKLGRIISAILLIILPLIILLVGLIINILNVWFYLAVFTWFGMGFIIYLAIH